MIGLTLSRTDLNTANDLWQKPRFPALKLSVSVEVKPRLRLDSGMASSSSFEATPIKNAFASSTQTVVSSKSSSRFHSKQTTIDTVLLELRNFAKELARIQRSLNPVNRPHISTSDKIFVLERKVFDLIHSPPPSTTPLDHACTVAALIHMRSNLRDNVCNFRIIETARLQYALIELGDLWQREYDLRDREKLVWTLGFGAVSSEGRPERDWFVSTFRHVCESVGLRRWEYVRAVFDTVLWKSELDVDGMRVWEDMRMGEM